MRRRLIAAVALLVLAVPLVPRAATVARPTHGGPVVQDALARRIATDPSATVDALMSVDGRATAADVAAVRALGVAPARVFDEFGVIYVVGAGRNVLRLAELSRATALVENAEIHFDGDTDMVASRARDAWDTKSGATPAKVGSTVIDGAGVGVAVVDSGVDAGNPDLANAMEVNKKYVCTTPGLVVTTTNTCAGNNILNGSTGCTNAMWVDASDTDTTSGHGTHVAGIVAGRGVASDGRFSGAAPGARLYGFGTGEYNRILYAIESFNWISCNALTVSPRIRVVNNSWSPPAAAYSATDPVSKAVDVLVSKGIVVVFSAGNSGGDGAVDRINPHAKSPTKGVIGVANYDDLRKASRAGVLNETSSRGLAKDANRNNWPDLSAPGTSIVSTGARSGAFLPTGTRTQYEPYYTTASGTSMSAPHVAGVAALLFQAKPTLTPGDVEDILEDHAVPFATPGGYASDPTNATSGTNFGAGHGLVDAIASLHDARVGATGGSALPQVSQNPHAGISTIDAQVVAGVQWTFPRGVEVTLYEQSLESGNTGAYPLSGGQAASFRIFPPAGSAFSVSTTLSATLEPQFFDMQAVYTFGSPGAYRIETQIRFGSVFKPIDSWVVRIV